MCGIVGIYAQTLVGQFYFIRLAKAIETQKHRGANSSNSFTNHRVALGHTRLSILDCHRRANQPMQDIDKDYTLTYNGEIYNHLALKSQLEQQGYSFETKSDTEVLLSIYKAYGENAFSKLDGFFALGIYEHKTETLCIARDPRGIKPLYYYRDEDKFIFASELRALMAFNIPKEFNKTSAQFYFRLNYVPAPLTILKNTYQLKPGHYIKIQKDKFIEASYTTSPKKIFLGNTSFLENRKELKNLLDISVRDRLMADVPIGTFLSGGIDSSLVAFFLKKYQKTLKTFHISYPEAPNYNEAVYAEQVAGFLDTQHQSIPIHSRNIKHFAKELLQHIDHPFADSSAISMYALCKYAKEEISVALSGDGGDELFGGYEKHRGFLMAQQLKIPTVLSKPLKYFLSRIPKNKHNKIQNYLRKMYRLLELYEKDTKEQYWSLACALDGKNFATMFKDTESSSVEYQRYKTMFLNELGNSADFRKFLLLDLQFLLPNDMLYKVDMTSMAHTLEVRVPMLSHTIVEFASSLPTEHLFKKGSGKYILKSLAHDLIPKRKLQPKKHGFDTPLQLLFQDDFLNWISKELLDDDLISTQSFWNRSFIQGLKEEMHSRKRYNYEFLWSLVVFQSWYKNYMSGCSLA